MLTKTPRLIRSNPSFGFLQIHPRRTTTPLATFHSSSQFLFQKTRAMASKKEYLCILPDKPGTLAKRLEVRPVHLDGVKPLVEAGKAVLGGAMFNSHPAEGETPSFKGSVLIYTVATEEEAWELIRKDIYSVTGVWDLDAAQVIPFKSAVRVAS